MIQLANDINLRALLKGSAPGEHYQRDRIRLMERNIGLPAKAAVILVLFYYLFFSNWFEDVTGVGATTDTPPREIALNIVRQFFLVYVCINTGVAALLLGMRQIPFAAVQNIVSASAWIDALLVAALTLVTGGFDSILFWVFPGLMVRNAISVPVATRQLVLNIIVTGCYITAGLLDVVMGQWESRLLDDVVLVAMQEGGASEAAAEPFFLRIALLVLVTLCCYGVQVFMEKQRTAQEEARELQLRQEQLQAAGRLAAEIAHQLKNPLGIINNAAFTLQRTVKEGKTITQQISIIREEVDRSDRILTELMGYAQLSEGKVEKLDVRDELDHAIDQVFPKGTSYETKVLKDYSPGIPPLMIQKGHLSEVFVNILQNAREAMEGKGTIRATVSTAPDFCVKVVIEDDGPGMEQRHIDKIFEPYFTTKEKGTGLGLAIVKHNTELYNGKVSVESELGKGARFTVLLPAKTVIRFRR
ncbi:MAG TPA: ATP-binding protein [Methylomirabilota bacterium]|nr:ATP-binding protein [Methylomirabilota bacterium]